MFNIDKFLQKFSNTIKNNNDFKESFCKFIKNKTSVDLKKEEIELKNGILFIKSSSLVKNSIFMNKNEILKEFPNIYEIRF